MGRLSAREGAAPIAEFNILLPLDFRSLTWPGQSDRDLADTVYTATPTTFAVGQTILLMLPMVWQLCRRCDYYGHYWYQFALKQMFIAPPVIGTWLTSGGAGN